MRSHSYCPAVAAACLVAATVAIPPARALTEPALTLAASSVVAGHNIVVSGAGWSPPLGKVRLQLEPFQTPPGEPVDIPVLPDGTFSGATVPVPLDTPQGAYRLAACEACGEVDSSLSADQQLTVLAHTLELDPTSAAAGEHVIAAGEAWNPEGGPVYLFAAGSPVCDQAVLASGTPDDSFAFSIQATVPARKPGEYRFMAAQCIGSKAVTRAFAPFTITNSSGAGTTPGSASISTPGSAAPTSRGGSPTAGSTSVQLAHTSLSRHYRQFGLLPLAVIAVALVGFALRFATRRPRHSGRQPNVTAAVAYRPAPPPLIHEATPHDRREIHLLTGERYGPVTSTEEQR
jgi:hypothetical protein